ncbi:MAG: hypothetical protein GAK37_01052 [Pseudomonas sp.]|nr:MAG: hypothetical protein GAK37_01052 [Pseudomonas sp.]
MAYLTPPYFFDEFLRPLKRDQPTPRERELGLTVRDLDWLHTLYYATDQARQDTLLRAHPMVVEKFSITIDGKDSVSLTGAFMMSPSPDEKKAVLYTPYAGLEVFENRSELLKALNTRLAAKNQLTELTRFLPINARYAVFAGKALALSTATIDDAVMEDQEHGIRASQMQNMQAMLDELRKTPTLDWMLDTLLAIMARSFFPGLNQRDTRMNSYITQDNQPLRWVASVPLSEALLQFYVEQAWPAGQTRAFTNPRYVTTGVAPKTLAEDLERWHRLIEQTSDVFSKLLRSLLKTYWHEDFAHGQSRLGFFTEVMSDKFRADLLLKRQAGIVSAGESQQLQDLFLSRPTATTGPGSRLQIERVRIHAPYQHYVELAGTLMTNDTHAYLYTQPRGLQVLADLDDLKATLLSMLKAAGHEDELLNFLSLEERSVFIGLDEVQITGIPVTGNAFAELAEDIAAKQLSNMDHALTLYRRSDGHVNLGALLDCALDVRSMFDPRLHDLDAGGRWSLNPVSTQDGRPSTVKAERAKRELPRLRAIETALAAARSGHPTLRRLAAHALDAEMQTRELGLKADEVYINTYASAAREREEREPVNSLNMVEFFIRRLAGETGPVPPVTHIWFYGPRQQGAAYKLASLTIALFNAIIERVKTTFAEHDIRTLPNLFLSAHQDNLSHAMLQGLCSETALRRLGQRPELSAFDILDTALEGDSPTRLTRHGLNGFLPDAFSLTLKTGTEQTLRALANCFVLTERGGTDPLLSGQTLLWTPRRGHEPFASIQRLRDALTQRLAHPDERMHLLENLPESSRVPHQSYQPGPLLRIDDHLLNNRQHSWRDYVRSGIDYRLSMGLGAQALQNSLDQLMQVPAPNNLPRAITLAQAIIRQQALPAWLGMAAPREQLLQAELLEQYRLSAPDERDFLHSITPLRDYVSTALTALLKARFAGSFDNPDDVLIPPRLTLQQHDMSLTDFALRHLPDLVADNIRPHSRTSTPLPATLDGHAVVQMVQQLNLKQVYGQLLEAHLGGTTEDTRQRRQLFCRQLPWQILRHAHEEHLEEKLTGAAWSFIQQIFDMPDALARDAVSGVTAMIRPLELIATAGASVARAIGLYLIGPQPDKSGPLVLYTPYRPGRVFQEYAREEDLLHELATPGVLRDWISHHLTAPHQAIYRNLWRQVTRSGATDIRLATTPITGNVLFRMFNDNITLLKKMLACQFEPSGKSQWDAATSLFREGIPKALQFMAGKLTYPLVVWRSYKLFEEAEEDLQQHRWSHGLKMFKRGVAQLASLRKELDTLLAPDDTPRTQRSISEWLDLPLPAATSLDTLDITEPRRTRMQVFEDHDVSLGDLVTSLVNHTYTDSSTQRIYVPVGGKVYPVKRLDERWRLSLGDAIGPYVQRNTQGDWVLDLSRHIARYGKTLSRYAGRVITPIFERQIINIEARGMREIAQMSSWKAQCINEALNVATYYAVTCKRNVSLFTAAREPLTRLGRFFTELFGVHRLTSDQMMRIEKKIDELLNELVNPSLTRPDSDRFVCGTSHWHPEDTYAFTLPDDRRKTIYLVNRFFDPKMDVYQNRLTAPFDLSAHARAATLIHELAHVVSDAEDIAYLDSMRPFHDLINVTIPGARVLKTDLASVRNTALSTLTPVMMLFKVWDDASASWQDLGSRRNSEPARDRIFKITGAKTLTEARQIFMSDEDKRIDVILANADSLSYMITQLGRMLDPGA